MLFICKKPKATLRMRWTGCSGGEEPILSHGSNRSAGVAVLFVPELAVCAISQTGVCKGRLLVVRARIQGLVFVFVNVYAHNTGRERTVLFKALRQELSHVEQDNILVLGEDFNCTIDPHSDRRSEEPHVGSAGVLVEIVADYDLVDTWRVKHPDKRGFTWVKAGPDRVSAEFSGNITTDWSEHCCPLQCFQITIWCSVISTSPQDVGSLNIGNLM